MATPPHWIAWLAAHPERTLGWLERAIAEGFEVHHVDGIHHNNDPGNVVLIDAVDHRRLHGRFVIGKSRATLINPATAKKAYDMRVELGCGWDWIGKLLKTSGITAQKMARVYADCNKLKWPIPCRKRIYFAWEHPVYPDSRL